MAATRDYYADLELPPTADIQEVKKQFRKLALKYHPDRNPGRELEVNSKFQVIQSAHEVLSDPQQKAKYDATVGRSGRFPAASGVKGNPWQNVGQNFPPPPRRNTAARNATSGAQRWQSRFSNGVPPTAKQQTASDSEAKKNAARAFENMRKSQSQGASKSAQQEARPPPPPPPPRTESARQRAEASFGARKPGFQPHSPMTGDEPPVSGQNYFTRPTTEQSQPPPPPPRPYQPTPMPDPLSQFRAREGFADTRQSTPYSSHGGEKTDPFDGIPPGRTKSAREPKQRDERTASSENLFEEQRRRSSSVPKPAATRGAASGSGVPREGADSWYAAAEAAANRGDAAPDRSRFNSKSEPKDVFDSGTTAGQDSNDEHQPTSGKRSGSAPSMYDTPDHGRTPVPSVSSANGAMSPENLDSIHGSRPCFPTLAPSGNQDAVEPHVLLEIQLHKLLDRLISNVGADLRQDNETPHSINPPHARNVSGFADLSAVISFSFAVGDDAFEQTSPVPDGSRFAKSSVDDINTRFVNDESSSTWHFTAGHGDDGGEPTGRPPSGRRANRCSPLRRPSSRATEYADDRPQPETASGGFNADGWSDQFSPQTFAPPPVPSASVSPTRASRANSKKARARPTVGNAAVVVEDSSSEEETYEWRGRNGQPKDTTADSPQAMDIDSPPSAPAAAPAEPSSVRNIPVEPSRPEWRPGNVETAAGDAKPERPEKIPLNANAVGSEDSEEFRASFADLKNVAPLAHEKAGLKSFEDLKDGLPFESKASEDLPIKLPKANPLIFPTPPEAPRLPPTVAIEGMKPNAASWVKYLADFESYLQLWDDFNGQVVDHFATRKAHISRTRTLKGYKFLGARSDGEIREYFNWVQQDNDVRLRWNAACDQHEDRLREFMAFREKMK
ncbi:hypothetical protein CDD83_3566 [Cordyceps sp. RAO-2017]|nr:hypothetical protein CDD83_3566 [Cordyceps sp. RAO-2017]